jgi:hypothetical protein
MCVKENMNDNEIIYGIDVEDVQKVANDVLERDLTDKEITLIENSVGNHIDWFQAIENAIQEQIHK